MSAIASFDRSVIRLWIADRHRFEGSWKADKWVAPVGQEKQAQMKRWYQGSREFDQARAIYFYLYQN